MRKDLIDVLPWLKSIRPLLTLVDPFAIVVAGLALHQHVTVLSVVGAALAGTIVCRGADLHRSRLVLSVLEDMPKLLLATVVAALTLVGISPLHGLDGRPSWALMAGFCGAAFVLLVLLRCGVYAGAHSLRRSGRSSHPVIIVGAGEVGRRLAEAFLTKREYGLVPVGIIDCSPDVAARDLPLPLLGGVADLGRAMVDLGVDDVVFAFPGPPDDQTIATVRQCVQMDHQVFVVPRFFEMMGMDHHRRVEVVRDVAVMRLRRSGLRPHTLFLKRLVDVVLTTAALVVLSPVLLACAVAVRIETGPGVIFRQTRVGIGGRNFTLFKFRSLKPATALESATEWNIDLDDRLGPVGRFLRRTSLDELPQLVNVLRGDMSLVGPRPERPFFVREFSQNRHRYDDRHRVQTGLTGWAQVNDLRGDTSIDDRVRFDNYYIENWSLWGDVKIMFRTVAALGRPQPAARALALAGAPAPAALSAATPPRARRGSARTPAPMVPASLRVVHVSMPTSEGVAEVVMAYVRDQLARGWHVTVVCPSHGRLGYAAREAGARVVWWQAKRNPGPGTLRETVKLRRILAEAKPDLVHLHSAKAGLAGRLVLRGRIPTIFQPHAWSFHAATGLLRVASSWWERLAARWTTELVCVSDGELEAGQQAGIRAACATVIPNGVSVGEVRVVGRSERAAARRTLGLPELPTVVCVGRLAPQKGQQDLLDAWPRVRARVPGAHLVLVGDGPDRELLEARVGPDSGITLVGARTDVPTWLTAANVVAVPSRWEGMALAPLEAMASSRSLVASDVVGIEGSLPPSAGALVAPGETDDLADALAARLADPELADAEGRRGRAHVESNFGTAGSVGSMATVSLRLAGTRTRSLTTSS
ncbi:MAG: wecA 1 [Nocardioides sp.]|nr:wecA 1 [Nocardioides sp.]